MKLNPYIKNSLYFLVFFVLINEGIKLYFSKVSVARHKLIKADEEFYHCPDTIDYLIMGHSRPYAAINTEAIPGCVQFCSGGETNIQTYYKLKQLLETSNKSINTIILPSGFPTYCLSKPELNINSFYWKRYVDYLELGNLADKKTIYTGIYLKAHLFPYYEYPYIRLMLFFDELNMVIPKYAYQKASPLQKERIAISLVNSQYKNKELYSPVSFLYLKKTLELIAKHNKKIVFVKYPITLEYRNAMQDLANNTFINTHLPDSIIRQFDQQIQVFDFSDIFDNHPEYFKDPQHLNKKGKEEFTRIIREKIE